LEIDNDKKGGREWQGREREGRGRKPLELTEEDSRPNGHVESVGETMNSYRGILPDP